MTTKKIDKTIVVIVILSLFFAAGIAGASLMRHNGCRIVVGDSIADVAGFMIISRGVMS